MLTMNAVRVVQSGNHTETGVEIYTGHTNARRCSAPSCRYLRGQFNSCYSRRRQRFINWATAHSNMQEPRLVSQAKTCADMPFRLCALTSADFRCPRDRAPLMFSRIPIPIRVAFRPPYRCFRLHQLIFSATYFQWSSLLHGPIDQTHRDSCG